MLPPLDPDAYLAWVWKRAGARSRPETVAEYAARLRITLPDARKDLLGVAVSSRYRGRLLRAGRALP